MSLLQFEFEKHGDGIGRLQAWEVNSEKSGNYL